MTAKPATLHVLLPLPVGSGYDYLTPEGLSLQDGAFVEVPLGSKFAVGIVWGKGTADLPIQRMKTIGQVLPTPPLSEALRSFMDWMAAYTLTPPGAVLKMVMGANWKLMKGKDKLDFPLPNTNAFHPDLTDEQRKAASCLVKAVKTGAFSVTLLDGVTGSGKTEVYSEAIAEAFKNDKQVLIMLPEIAMTAALTDRLTARFGVKPTEWHSELTDKQRRLNWHAITRGEARFVLGARSALMLPYANLGLIVVDEEHEAAFKQEEGVIYHGRDMAVVRARFEKIPIILASATPSLETLHNAAQGKYQHVVLKNRFGVATMPTVQLVDLRKEKLPSQNFISETLLTALKETIAKGQQSMLFLNRRGYAPLTLCRACGHRLQCANCSSWLIAHKKTGRLHCHHCDSSMKLPEKCPKCGAEDKFAACGPGIERIAEEVKTHLPEARAAIMASDTLDGPKAAQELIKQMEDRSIDILVGTQIMAKGYHFPRLTLVGVIDADLGLSGGDPRAAERTFQLLQQVSGRSGRAEDKGRVYLQTTSPDHPVMKALVKGDRDAFFAAELHERKTYALPPFSRLASLIVTGTDVNEVIRASNRIASLAPQNDKIKIMGPAPAPFALLRGRYRYRILVQSARSINLPEVLRNWLGQFPLPRSLRIQIDVDPYTFF